MSPLVFNPDGMGAGSYAAAIQSNGEIVPVPESGLLSLLGLGLAACLRRIR